MIHEILPVGMLQCNCSIFGDQAGGEALIIDPGDEIERIMEVVERHRLRVKWIVVTHAHIDHIGGAKKLHDRTGAPVYMNEADLGLYGTLNVQAAWIGLPRAPEVGTIDVNLRDGDTLQIGSASGMVLHTPGHTEGSISLYFPHVDEGKLFAGDTLFQGSIGRTDLPGGNYRKILHSIKNKLLALKDDVTVIPGHGPLTTIGRERVTNPFLQDL